MHFSTVAEIEIPSLETSQSAEEATPTPGKRKRTTRGPHESKDPNAPRRPQTAYMMFTNDVRKDVRLDHPDTSVSDRAKIIGRMWSEFEETKKKVRVRDYKLQNLTILAPLCKVKFHVHTVLLLRLTSYYVGVGV